MHRFVSFVNWFAFMLVCVFAWWFLSASLAYTASRGRGLQWEAPCLSSGGSNCICTALHHQSPLWLPAPSDPHRGFDTGSYSCIDTSSSCFPLWSGSRSPVGIATQERPEQESVWRARAKHMECAHFPDVCAWIDRGLSSAPSAFTSLSLIHKS